MVEAETPNPDDETLDPEHSQPIICPAHPKYPLHLLP